MAQSIAQTLESFLNTDATQITTSFVERHKVAKLLHALIQKFESPMDTILRLIWQQPTMMAALKVCHDLGIFQTLATASGFMSLEDLVRSTKSNIRPELLHRLLRHLAAMGALREQDPVSYASTPFSDALTKKEVVGGLSCWFDIFGPVFLAMPEYLATHDYQGNNPKHGIWQTIKGTDLPLFPYLSLNPQMMNNFANNMAGYASDRGRWTDIYPVSERLLQDVEEDEVVIVDVGGGLGQDMKNFLRLHPKTGAKLVVQDLPEVIEEAQRRSKEDITFLAHDFFTPQPLKGILPVYMEFAIETDCLSRCTSILSAQYPPRLAG